MTPDIPTVEAPNSESPAEVTPSGETSVDGDPLIEIAPVVEGDVTQSPPPEDYRLNVPEAYADRIQADLGDPRVEGLFEIAKANGWKQDVVDELVALEYANAAAAAQADTQAHASEKEALIKLMDPDGTLGGEGAMKAAQDVGNWAVNVLSGDIKANPAIADEIRFSATTANGVAMLQAFMNRTKISAAPRARDAGGPPNPWSSTHFNLTEQGRIVRENPDLAASLKAQASR